MTRFFIYLFFTLSGSVALIYEALWSRYLKLFLGHSSYGQVVTLIMFMGGLGLGSFLAARYLKRVNHPFLAYARIELIAAVFGFSFHAAYELMTNWFFTEAASLQAISPLFADSIQIGICMLLTLPFATLLGMTFPLIASGMIRSFPDGGQKSLPTLYFANSLGGAIGILFCSYFLVSAVGTQGALQVASMGNLIVAAGFYAIFRFSISKTVSPEESALEEATGELAVSEPIRPTPLENPRIKLWLFIAAGTGLASFIYEVGWIRLLSLILGSSAHSFDAMISAFILGLAFGGLAVKRLLTRCRGDLAPVLGVIQVLMGSFAALSLYLYQPFFDAIQASHGLLAKTEAAFPLHSAFKYFLCLALMFPAAFCAGMTLPLITWRLVRDTGNEKYTGLVYGWNTIGSIIGAALAGLLLMPALQLKWTIFTGAALDISLGLILLSIGVLHWKKRRPAFPAIGLRVAAVAATAAVLLPAFWTSFDGAVLCSGAYRTSSGTRNNLLEVRHGKTATISVGKDAKRGFIATNGKSDGAIWVGEGNFTLDELTDETTVAMLAALPMLTRDEDYDAALIGLGTGLTGHYLLTDDRLRSLDLIEIEEAVIDLSKHFRPRNERLWNDDRLNIVVDDAKRHFYANRKSYDIIISEPSNPWVSGVAGLFTKEFYEHLQHFLNPGGILVQWVHGYEFSDELLVSILSALDTFEHFEIYSIPGGPGDYIVVAGNEPFDFIDPDKLAANSELDEEFERFHSKIEDFGPGNFLASSKSLRANLEQLKALTNSDYFPYVEQHSETAFFTSNEINLPSIFTDSFIGYTDIFEPERARKARGDKMSLNRLRKASATEAEKTEFEKTLHALLESATAESEWQKIEMLLYSVTLRSAGTEAWPEEPFVKRMKELAASGIMSPSVRSRLNFLENLARNDHSAAGGQIEAVIKGAEPKVMQHPFWIRTFFAASVRLNRKDLVDYVMREGVGKCDKLSPDERILISSLNRIQLKSPAQEQVADVSEPE